MSVAVTVAGPAKVVRAFSPVIRFARFSCRICPAAVRPDRRALAPVNLTYVVNETLVGQRDGSLLIGLPQCLELLPAPCRLGGFGG